MKYWRETLAVAQRILIELLRRRRSLILWAVFPISILVMNGMIMAHSTPLNEAEAFRQTAPPTLVGAALFFSCLGGTVATIVAEREQQTLKRLFISPLSGVSYFLGILLAHSLIGIGQTLLVFSIAVFAGAEFRGQPWLIGLIIFLSIVAYVGVGFLLGTQMARRTEDVNTLIASLGVPLLLLGGAFVPISFFPQTMLDLAEFNPIYHMNEALTAVAAGGDGLAEMGRHFWFLVGFAAVTVAAGWLSYRRMLNIERRL